MKKYFVTGIGTGVGKTIVSAILVEMLKADYWKPIQSGDLENSDTLKVANLVSNNSTIFFKEQFRLNTALSPHASAKIDGIEIKLSDFKIPETENNLIIEGAGGLMVPINQKPDLMIDLMKHLDVEVILVCSNYLGSINHTLMSINTLKQYGVKIKGIVFNGTENVDSESIIEKYSLIPVLFRVAQYENITKERFAKIAKTYEIP
ncbi:MAG: dethiobiotin synthase [Bacteroidota bacterium]